MLTQVAQSVIAEALAQAASRPPEPSPSGAPPAASGPAIPAMQVVTLHPTSAAGRAVPLAASALLWLATLIGNVLVIALAPRLCGGRPLGRTASIGTAVTSGLLGSGAVLGLARLWDAGIPLRWDAAGFLALVGVAFTLLQAGVLRWLGLQGCCAPRPALPDGSGGRRAGARADQPHLPGGALELDAVPVLDGGPTQPAVHRFERAGCTDRAVGLQWNRPGRTGADGRAEGAWSATTRWVTNLIAVHGGRPLQQSFRNQ